MQRAAVVERCQRMLREEGACLLPGMVKATYGTWTHATSKQSSNFRELNNLVNWIEEEVKSGRMVEGTEVFLATDNFVSEKPSTEPRGSLAELQSASSGFGSSLICSASCTKSSFAFARLATLLKFFFSLLLAKFWAAFEGARQILFISL